MLLLLIPPVAVVRARNGPYSGPVPPTYGYDATSAVLQRPAWAKPRRDAAAASAFGDAQPECDVPIYSLTAWKRAHGRDFPDHPCIFAADASTATRGFAAFPDMDRFLALFGNETVEALPGYAQAGGQYCAINVGCRVKIRATLSDLASQWTGALAGFYVSQFGCGPLCERVLPYLGVPELFADAQPRTMNLLVGPARTGLPFHYHQRTWQALSFGRKAWFLVPPGRMSDDLARVVGPRIWPGDGFVAATRGVPPGQRPLRCVQYPGEIIWLPENWWHATLNLDASVAYGQKPLLPEPGRLAHTPDVRTPLLAAFATPQANLPWFELIEIRASMQRSGWDANRGLALLERTAAALHDAAASAASLGSEVTVIHAAAAFGLCVLADSADNSRTKHGWPASQVATHTAKWRRAASTLDNATCSLQCAENCPAPVADDPSAPSVL